MIPWNMVRVGGASWDWSSKKHSEVARLDWGGEAKRRTRGNRGPK